MSWIPYILLYAFIVYLGICLIYFVIQEKLIFVPKHISDLKSYNFTLPYSQRVYHTSNNGLIHGLLFKNENSKGLIFYLHGNTGSLKRWGYTAEEICDFGYDVFALDYRGFGKSKGMKSEKIMHQDALEVFNEVKLNYENERIVVYGRSLGAAFAVRLASQVHIDLLILETPFYSLVDVGRRNFPFMPIKLLLRYKFYSNIYLAAVQCPIQIFHGTKDLLVPYESAFNLYNKYKSELDITMTTMVGGKHNNINSFALYREKMQEILS